MRRLGLFLVMVAACKAPPPAAPTVSMDDMASRQAVAFLRCFERDGAECRQTAPRRSWVALSLLAKVRDEIPTIIVEGFDAEVDELGNEVALRRGFLRELQTLEAPVRKGSCQAKPGGVIPFGKAVAHLSQDAEDRLVALGLGENERASTLAAAAQEASELFKQARIVEFKCAGETAVYVALSPRDPRAPAEGFVAVALTTGKPIWLERRIRAAGTRERLQITVPGENLIDPWLPVYEEQI